jgi:hypothetical protein
MPDGTLNFYHAIIDKLGIENLDGVSGSVIESTQAELQAEYDNNQYQRNRKEEYASIPDQLDYIFHNGIEKWKTDMVLPVKEKYPKGAE